MVRQLAVATTAEAFPVGELQEMLPDGLHEHEHEPPKMPPLQLHLQLPVLDVEQLTVGPMAMAPPPEQPAPS